MTLRVNDLAAVSGVAGAAACRCALGSRCISIKFHVHKALSPAYGVSSVRGREGATCKGQKGPGGRFARSCRGYFGSIAVCSALHFGGNSGNAGIVCHFDLAVGARSPRLVGVESGSSPFPFVVRIPLQRAAFLLRVAAGIYEEGGASLPPSFLLAGNRSRCITISDTLLECMASCERAAWDTFLRTTCLRCGGGGKFSQLWFLPESLCVERRELCRRQSNGALLGLVAARSNSGFNRFFRAHRRANPYHAQNAPAKIQESQGKKLQDSLLQEPLREWRFSIVFDLFRVLPPVAVGSQRGVIALGPAMYSQNKYRVLEQMKYKLKKIGGILVSVPLLAVPVMAEGGVVADIDAGVAAAETVFMTVIGIAVTIFVAKLALRWARRGA